MLCPAIPVVDGAFHPRRPGTGGGRSSGWVERIFQAGGGPPDRDETDGAGRELEAEAPVGDKVVLDFNRADRPTCAFSTYSLCPLPPRQNRLPLRVQAGEKRPPSH